MKNTIGNRIKISMNELDITFKIVCERTFIATTTLNRYRQDRNEPDENWIKTFCREFGINEAWLKTGEGQMTTLSLYDGSIRQNSLTIPLHGTAGTN